MITATLRRSAPSPTVTVAPLGSVPPGSAAPSAPAGSATPTSKVQVVEAQIVEAQGEKIECQNTAAPSLGSPGLHTDHDEPGLESILPPSTPEAPLPDHPAPPEAGARSNTAALTIPPQAALTVYEPDDDGFDATDDRHPTLRIVAGSGKLSTMFNVGSVILGMSIDESEQLLVPPDPQKKVGGLIRFVPLSLKKFWRENLSDEDAKEGLTPRTFKTVEEVEANGGITVWIDRTPPTFKPSSTCLMLIEKPEASESALFQIELDGKFWCPAVFYAGNSAYKTFALPLHNTSNTMLQVPVLGADGQPQKDPRGFIIKERYWPKYIWTFQVKQTLKTRNDKTYTVFVPDIHVQSKASTGPELRNFVDSFLPKTPGHAAGEE